jgi:tRNA nucleotidyltransferase (CCA-adding enzyme)
MAIEVTTFRKSVEFEDGERHSITGFSNSPEQDINSRDFTINALLFDGDKVIDLVGGLKDLDNKIIRAVGIPGDRFTEDALRMVRAIRFSCQLNFSIEHNTLGTIGLLADLIKKAAPERIRDELVKILSSPVPSTGLRLLQSTGLLKYFLPELEACYKFDQLNPYHDKDVFDHILAVVDYTPNDPVLRMSALLHDIAKPEAFTIDDKGIGHFYDHNLKGETLSRLIMGRLKYDNKTTDIVGNLVREHMSKLQNPRPATVKKLINRVGAGNVFRLIDLMMADEAGSAPPHNFEPMAALKDEVQRILKNAEPLAIRDLAVSGEDLIEMGFKEGPEIGLVLNKLLKRVIASPELNNKKLLSEMARKLYKKTRS